MQRLVLPHRQQVLLPLIAGLVVLLGAAAAGGVVGLRPALAPLILVAPLAAAAAWVAYRAPGVTFAAYLAIPFYKAGLDPFFPIDLTVVLALVNLMQAALLFAPFGRNAGDRRPADPVRRRGVLVWLLLTALIVLGVFYAPDPGFGLERTINWVALSALPLLAAFRVASEARFVRQFLWSLFAVGVAVTAAGLWLLPQVGAWPADRLVVFGAHTIRVGQAALLVPLIGFAYVLPTTKAVGRLTCLALIPPALLVSASSGSRGPLLMAGIAFMLFLARDLVVRLLTRRQGPMTIAPVRIAVAGMVAILLISLLQPSALVAVLPETATDRIGTISEIVTGLATQDLDQSSPDDSTAGRLIAYDGAVEMFDESPIIGGGTGSFAEFTATVPELSDWTGEAAYPHNLILQFAAEYGLVGLLVLVVLLFGAFRGLLAKSHTPAWNAILVLLAFFLLSALVSNGIIDNRTLWGFVVLGLAAATADRISPPVSAPAQGISDTPLGSVPTLNESRGFGG